jgi:RNA polymerase sigma-70 factor (ECF subfamily)
VAICDDLGMSATALARARAGDEEAFRELTGGLLRELQLHCYRMLGSLHDAEDAVQETLVAAWRGLDGFEERASLRTWLYRIATNRCLNMLRAGGRRPRVVTGGLPFEPPPPTRMTELTYLEPYPDALLDGVPDAAPGPEARYELREAVGIAFIAALQRLSDRQRAVLVLRDVLGYRAGEVAELLDVSEATVNSALVRARAALDARAPATPERLAAPGSAQERELAADLADAFEQGDMDRVVALLTEDAWVTMPPEPFEYQGREAATVFFEHVTRSRTTGARWRLLPTRANGQPAYGQYLEDPAGGGVARPRALFVLTIRQDGVAVFARFAGEDLPIRCGLPEAVPLAGGRSSTR